MSKEFPLISVQVLSCEQKTSAKSGSIYYIVSYYAWLGSEYPDLISDYSPEPVGLGKQNIQITLVSDRNKNLGLVRKFLPVKA